MTQGKRHACARLPRGSTVSRGFWLPRVARYLKETPLSEGSSGVFYPGEVEYLREQERCKSGIEVEDATWKQLRALAAELKTTDVAFD